jgi:tRNA threonylcarbamoyladenosine biosynthesis protein TsaB
MILLLDTSTPVCRLTLVNDEHTTNHEWEANRDLAHGLLGYLKEKLAEAGKGWTDITGIVAYKGPGSFTGLRIGLTVLNTLTRAEHIPIVGTSGEAWQQEGIARLIASENDEIVLPEYGGEPHITTPRK